MSTRRTGLLTALVLTAALFLSMPGLFRSLLTEGTNRTHESLRPPQARTLTVWLVHGMTEDRQLLSRAISIFEKANPEVRIFLRSAPAEALFTPDAVLPDIALYETGSLNLPQEVFLPLAGEMESCGMFAGVSYAVPLWLSPNVLSLPTVWLEGAIQPSARADSLLAAATPEPERNTQTLLTPQHLPWERLLQPGALQMPEGVALAQLLSMCPYPMRTTFTQSLSESTTEPHARVETLQKHLEAVRNQEAIIGCMLTPATSDQVRCASLCRDSAHARTFLQFLRTETAADALASGLIPLTDQPLSAPDALSAQAFSLFQLSHTLPNVFAHTKEELRSLCRDAFSRCADPVETLLRLR